MTHNTVPIEQIQIDAGAATLPGFLCIPPAATGMVIFAHGTDSGRFSPVHRRVARAMHQAGIATLLFDLLTIEEEAISRYTSDFHLDNRLFVERVGYAIEHVAHDPRSSDLPIGFYGSAGGAGVVLGAARLHADRVHAVVAVGGPLNITTDALHELTTPTLFVVGDKDDILLRNDRHAIEQLGTNDKQLVVLAGASSEFERTSHLDEIAQLATEWLLRRLTPTLC